MQSVCRFYLYALVGSRSVDQRYALVLVVLVFLVPLIILRFS